MRMFSVQPLLCCLFAIVSTTSLTPATAGKFKQNYSVGFSFLVYVKTSARLTMIFNIMGHE